jgi:hypothetical protein
VQASLKFNQPRRMTVLIDFSHESRYTFASFRADLSGFVLFLRFNRPGFGVKPYAAAVHREFNANAQYVTTGNA